MTIAYRGDDFHGFATNPGVPTVAGTLEAALTKVIGSPIRIEGAGRTDAGVHAWGQVVSMDLPDGVDVEVLARQMNALCGPGIVVREASFVSPDFHARYSASWRSYRYGILNSAVGNPFLNATTWHVPRPLNLRVMRLASDAIIGEHDFSAFCRRPKSDESAVDSSMRRYVYQAEWRTEPRDLVRFDVRANAFCHQMVRALVGIFVEIGLGKRPPSDVRGLILSGDRSKAAQVAPAHGLCLWEVGYPAGV
jgi:tRNA pseudouridine38-40 synthase